METELYGEVPCPNTFQELLDVVSASKTDGHHNTRFWRGQASVGWRIDATAFRRVWNGEMPYKSSALSKKLSHHEEYLIKGAEHRSFDYFEGKKLSEIEIMARLRHFGAASALLDVSKNIMVALWFACVSEPNKFGLLVGLHCHHVGGVEGRAWGRNDYVSFLREEALNYDHPMLFDPSAITPRIAAQSSAFLFGKVSESKMGSLVYESMLDAYLFIVISPNLKREILQLASEDFSINRLSLFPDIEGFAQSHTPEYEMYGNERW